MDKWICYPRPLLCLHWMLRKPCTKDAFEKQCKSTTNQVFLDYCAMMAGLVAGRCCVHCYINRFKLDQMPSINQQTRRETSIVAQLMNDHHATGLHHRPYPSTLDKSHSTITIRMAHNNNLFGFFHGS